MFKTILALLVIAIIFLGIKIRDMSYEVEKDIAQKKTRVKEAIDQIKEEASEKIKKAEEIYSNLKNDPAKDDTPVRGPVSEQDPGADIRPEPPPLKIDRDAKPSLKLEPLDEEDLRLTAEVLNHDKKPPEPISGNDPPADKIQDTKISPEQNPEPKASGLDIERLAHIRNLYLEAIEVLNWE